MTEIDIFELPVHPAADAFPMMEEEELEELAADIKVNGLQQPLVINTLDGEPILIDGRNRREACRRVGIVPDYVLLDGADPVTYILSANIHRRNMSKGQRAMAVAKISPESQQGKRTSIKTIEVSPGYVSHARIVLQHAPDLANAVLMGHLSLDNAYEEARIRKGRAETYESRFNALKAAAPDLADMVVNESLNLEEAEAVYRERAEQREIWKWGTKE